MLAVTGALLIMLSPTIAVCCVCAYMIIGVQVDNWADRKYVYRKDLVRRFVWPGFLVYYMWLYTCALCLRLDPKSVNAVKNFSSKLLEASRWCTYPFYGWYLIGKAVLSLLPSREAALEHVVKLVRAAGQQKGWQPITRKQLHDAFVRAGYKHIAEFHFGKESPCCPHFTFCDLLCGTAAVAEDMEALKRYMKNQDSLNEGQLGNANLMRDRQNMYAANVKVYGDKVA